MRAMQEAELSFGFWPQEIYAKTFTKKETITDNVRTELFTFFTEFNQHLFTA